MKRRRVKRGRKCVNEMEKRRKLCKMRKKLKKGRKVWKKERIKMKERR